MRRLLAIVIGAIALTGLLVVAGRRFFVTAVHQEPLMDKQQSGAQAHKSVEGHEEMTPPTGGRAEGVVSMPRDSRTHPHYNQRKTTSMRFPPKWTIQSRLEELRESAQQEYINGNYSKSLQHAKEALLLDPYDLIATHSAALASCYLKDRINAQIYVDRLPSLKGFAKRHVAKVCKRNGINLVGIPP